MQQPRIPLSSPSHQPLIRPGSWLLIMVILMAAAAPAVASTARAPLPITDARTCAALAVYAMGTQPEWDARAERAISVLSKADQAGQLPDCSGGLGSAMAHNFSPALWNVSLALVDAAREALNEANSRGRCIAAGGAL